MTTNLALSAEWNKRNKLRAKGLKLWAKGATLRAERAKLWADGIKLWVDGVKLRAEGDIVFLDAVIAKYGNCKIEWKSNGNCLLENGDEYKASN